MAGTKCHLTTPSNFQQSAMLEGSEITETEALTTDSTLASSVTACKKNEKALCRLGLLDADADASLTTICFVNLDHEKMDFSDDKGIKRLASVSPDLPKMVESLNVHPPKEKEILLLGGLQAPDSFHTRSQSSTRCSGQRLSSHPRNIILEINRFLIGLQWGRDRHHRQPGRAGPRIDDDTNRSISSIEEDFLTASEHLEEDKPRSGEAAEGLSSQRGQSSRPDSEDLERTTGNERSQQRTCSFELPKIVIVQSPDSSEGAAEWPGTQAPKSGDEDGSLEAQLVSEQETQPHKVHNKGHLSKSVEAALACAASIIGTITDPQMTEQITMESSSEEDTGEEQQESEDGADYSFSSAMCGMAKLAGAVAAVELTEDVTEGTSIEAFRANIAEVLHREAAEVLAQPQGYKSVAHLLEITHNKIDCADHQQMQPGKGAIREPLSEISVACAERRDDLATTVVSMATELAAICLENSTGKQPWFCGLKGAPEEGPEAYILPACRTVLRRKEGQNGSTTSKKHRAPRLSEIKRKTEEQPELMEHLVNRVVDETVNPEEPQDPFALFASEVTARIMNCPELNVVDTSKAGQPRSRLQCERWSRGKTSSYESIPEEDGDPLGTQNTLGPGSRLGQNLSRGSSISKQSSCESITDEFSRFMVNQMENEGRGFDLLLDYYAGKNASSILAAAVQQAATKKNGHLNVRATSCLSKQSSTESITEEFYRFMLKDMDKENKDYSYIKTKEWSNSLLPPSPRTSFCIRQSSVPDRRSSDSRLTVGSPIKANSFDGFARNSHGDTLNIYPSNSVSASGLCKSDSCLYQRGKTDHVTDLLIHETWSSSIESLMRKNKIIADPEDSIELEAAAVDSQPQVQQFANRLAANIVETGKSSLGGTPEGAGSPLGWQQQPRIPVGERRRGFKQSRPGCSRSKGSQEQAGTGEGTTLRMRCTRDVPLIHIEGDQKDTEASQDPMRVKVCRQDVTPEVLTPKHSVSAGNSSSERPAGPVAALVKQDKRSLSASSEESMGSWSQVTPEEDLHEETSSFIQLSEGTGTSSASSVGVADLEAFSDVPSQSTVITR
ncbi:hypothetical protein NHX12_008066 [Muraenolepis orangiensis]|uniref:A-kinase anchor protein SPHKAP n=1 Tax=Muraenolepis orangiensis TaxID=630683 RepID=A0A9Q0I7R4_9TELE|nr:hypothetical protein NHX12_008066 [Muraenolepis orangiensis]